MQPHLDVIKNREQLKGKRYTQLQNLKISKDQTSNVRILIPAGLKGFINYLAVEPRVNIYISHPSLIKLTNSLIKSKQKVIFNYDTTFNLGTLYVTPIVARNLNFKSEPIFSVSFLLHERKFETEHLMFLIHLFNTLAKLEDNCAFMHDREKAIVN